MIKFTIEPTESDNIIYKFTSDSDFTSSKDTEFKEFMQSILFDKEWNYKYEECDIDKDSSISIEVSDNNMDFIRFFKDGAKKENQINPFNLVFERMDVINKDMDGNEFVILPVNNLKTAYVDQFKKILHEETRKPDCLYFYF